jgi:hypothetical protein
MGLLGLASFLLVLGVGCCYLFRTWRRTEAWSRRESILLGFTVALAGGLVGGVFDHYLFSYSHGVALFWLFLGLAVASALISETSGCGPEPGESVTEPGAALPQLRRAGSGAEVFYATAGD